MISYFAGVPCNTTPPHSAAPLDGDRIICRFEALGNRHLLDGINGVIE